MANDTFRRSDYESIRSGKSGEDPSHATRRARELLPIGFRTAREIPDGACVSTGCPIIDGALGGGPRRRHLTEIYGESGSGKTQIALQIAANSWKTGVIYLCTEGTFPTNRLQQFFPSQNISLYGQKIFIMHIVEIEDLIRCLKKQTLALLNANPSISVIIVDSIAAPFRGNFQEGVEYSAIDRARDLKEAGTTLLKYAKDFNLAALCINQVSADFAEESHSGVIPCLGLAWSNVITTRIRLSKTDRKVDGKNTNYEKLDNNTDISTSVWIKELKVIFSPNLSSDLSLYYVIKSEGILGLK